MKIVTVIGARPQFIKAAALSRTIRAHPEIQEVIIHTGQHYDANMSEVFFEQMDIPRPHYQLNIKSQYHGQMTGRMLEEIEQVLVKERPEMVIVYGDTNSTLAGSLAAKKLDIKVVHIEAGLRSYNMKMPEEINRILTDRISDILFCPSALAIENLKREGFNSLPCKLYEVGDIMKDVAYYYNSKEVKPAFDVPDNFLLATLHRAENTDDSGRLLNILKALQKLSFNIGIVLPLHPRTKKQIEKLDFRPSSNFLMPDPVGYLQMIYLLRRCRIVITDSGGLQKEAYYFDKYCVTTRDETEWTELTKAGYNKLTGANTEAIIDAVNYFLKSSTSFDKRFYGDGNTSNRILEILNTYKA
jgi:UDP-GlcNAc3NAcA epimerase